VPADDDVGVDIEAMLSQAAQFGWREPGSELLL